MLFFNDIEEAEFIGRPNRFLVVCLKDRKRLKAFLPNPGRLQELLLPGRTLLLVKEVIPGGLRKYAYTVVAVERGGMPVMLHTHKTNQVARYLIDQGKIPGLENSRVIAQEVRMGHSRFDFLVDHQGKEMLLEVKSCTLFGGKVAMFPDAVTERGTRHLRELADLSRAGTRPAVLFLVHWPKARWFLPDYHTDLTFARTMLACRSKVLFLPVAIEWLPGLTLGRKMRLLKIPWPVIEKEAVDQGSYLLILRLARARRISVGKLGRVFFPAGYYVYVGSARANLTRRMERHRRLRKTVHWHIDHLRAKAEYQTILPIRSSEDLECELAARVAAVSDRAVSGFGSSDCACFSHLFRMKGNPLHFEPFTKILQYFRMERLAMASD